MKMILKRANGGVDIVETKKQYRLDAVKEFLTDCMTVEFVWFEREQTFCMAVDEDGLMKQLPNNFFLQTNNPVMPIQPIVGDVVFVRVKPVDDYSKEIWDLEVAECTEEDVTLIKKLLDDKTQAVLAFTFSSRGVR